LYYYYLLFIKCLFFKMSNIQNEERTIEFVTKAQDNGIATSIINHQPVLLPQGAENRLGVTFTSAPAKAQTAYFDDLLAQPGYGVDAEMDSTFAMQDSNDDDLADFFSRPIKISTGTIQVGIGHKVFLNPWTLFFTNPRVVNRICNFNLLRCNLKLKFVINGNSFYYGRFIASYVPFGAFDVLRERNTLNRFIDHVTLATQLPHIFLDPTTSQGGCLTLPYFHWNSNMSIPGQKWNDMGELFIDTIANLQHANGGTDSISYTIFAYAENVVMSIPTSVQPAALSPQGKKEKTEDEVVTGKISGLASAAALGFKAFASYAPIAPYAMAASYAATMISGVARLFGYSRPRITSSAPDRFKPEYYGNLANTDVGENAYALSLDSKNQVTIDPRVAGLSGIDCMTISHIVSHESFFHLIPWSTARIPEACLAQIRVDPGLYRQLATTKFLTSTAFATLPFKYWTGSLRFRFQVICSAHHRGRIRVVYDPVSLGVTAEYNINYNYIVDIAETQDFTLSIPPCQEKPLMRAFEVNTATADLYTTGAALPPNTLKGNGVIGIYVVNDLAIPALTAADVSIAVYVSGGEDFSVFAPTDTYLGGMVLKPQGMTEPTDSDMVNTNIPVSESTDMINPMPDSRDYLPLIYCGERIVSIRPLIKRYCYHHSWGGDSTGSGTIAHGINAFPYNRGNVPFAINSRANTPGPGIAYNYCNTTALNYFSWAYAGWRGSIRWKTALSDFTAGTGINSTTLSMYSQRVPDSGSYFHSQIAFATDSTGSSNASRVLQNRDSTGWDGICVTNTQTNPVLELELPYYSDKRLQLCALADRTSLVYANTQGVEGKITYLNIKTGASNIVSVDEYVAAGDDFTFLFYMGPPPLFLEADFPAI
jgi:hypothetical protein